MRWNMEAKVDQLILVLKGSITLKIKRKINNNNINFYEVNKLISRTEKIIM